jgi:hypothetical protein
VILGIKGHWGRIAYTNAPEPNQNVPPLPEASDWNDLVRLKGCEFARSQMHEKLLGYRGKLL